MSSLRDSAWELRFRKYNALDVIVTARVAMAQEVRLREEEKQFPKIRQLVSDIMLDQEICRRMSLAGLATDQQMASRFDTWYTEKTRVAEEKFAAVAATVWDGDEPVNPRSPKQVARLLYDLMEVAVPSVDGEDDDDEEDGEQLRTTNKKALAVLADAPDVRVQLIAKSLASYRLVSGIHGRYIRPAMGHPVIHTQWRLDRAPTGRLASKAPNLQVLPVTKHCLGCGQQVKKDRATGVEVCPEHGDGFEFVNLRSMYVARKGYVLVGADYKQLEMRIKAYMAECGPLIDILESGADPHDAAARELFGLRPDEKVTKLQRTLWKNTLYGGIMYGGTADVVYRTVTSVVDDEGNRIFSHITPHDIRVFLRKLNAKWPELIKHNQSLIRETGSQGHYCLPISGRIFRYLNGRVPTQVVNYPIQGTAADIANIAMRKVHARLPDALRLQVHDFLGLEVPRKHEKKARRILQECMEEPVELLGIERSFPVDVSSGERWSDL